MHPVTLSIEHTDGDARATTATTARGTYRTPCFMPVGTRGAIKYLSAADYERLGAEIVLGNTYHLMLRPGAQTIAEFGGLGRFAGWNGLTLTDSGGFQVWSLETRNKVSEDGVEFRAPTDGSLVFLSPERAMEVKAQLGSDIKMIFDECSDYPATGAEARASMELSLRWALWAPVARAQPTTSSGPRRVQVRASRASGGQTLTGRVRTRTSSPAPRASISRMASWPIRAASSGSTG
jgi:queuine tRNA-ribosyltransferase